MRRNNFDALRLLGALLVLFSHQFALSGRWEPRFVGGHSFGNLGVLIFFSISGYLVQASWKNDPHWARFLSRRFLRIAPGLIVSLVLTASIVLALGVKRFPGNPLPQFNGSLWTIQLEVCCYLLLLGCAIVFRRPALYLCVALLAAWYTSGGQWTTSYLAYFGLFFAIGALLNEYPRLRSNRFTVAFCFVGLLFLLIDQTILGLALVVPPLAIAIGARSWPVCRDAGRIGDLSYGIYIYAWPTQQLWVHWLGAKSGYFTLVVPSLLATLALAYASWHLIEQPALRMKPRKKVAVPALDSESQHV